VKVLVTVVIEQVEGAAVVDDVVVSLWVKVHPILLSVMYPTVCTPATTRAHCEFRQIGAPDITEHWPMVKMMLPSLEELDELGALVIDGEAAAEALEVIELDPVPSILLSDETDEPSPCRM
jgi:hypothetical protein